MPDSKTSPAVYGIETEYSCMITLPGNVVHEIVGSCHSVDMRLGLYQEPSEKGTADIHPEFIHNALKDMGIISNSMGLLSNGGRLYIDPSGPEYATPETATAEDAVHRTFDGDHLVLSLFEHLRHKNFVEGYQINRRIVDHNRSSRGIHLNNLTQLEDKEPSPYVSLLLATTNIAKGALFGSGGLLLNEDGNTEYHHSPRLSLTTSLESHYTNYRQRPLVRTPFKPDGEDYSRVETVTSDALNFGWPLRASLVTTHAVLGLLEMGYHDKLPILPFDETRAVAAAHNVGQYGADGIMYIDNEEKIQSIRSLDVLKHIAQVALEINDTENYLDKESDQVLQEVITVADAMANDSSNVANHVESVARYAAMQRKMDKDGLSIDSETLCRFDYAWDWLGGGIAETLRSRGKVGWAGFKAASIGMAKHRIQTPPNTRAKLRGEAIKNLNGLNDSDWDTIDFGPGKSTYVHPLTSDISQLHLQ